jgi:two-component system chemotaxis response regulator CheB
MLPARIVTVGASAGGVESLTALVASLPPDLNAAVFVVLHIPPNLVSSLPEILSKRGPLRAIHPTDGDRIEAGYIYVAPPDHHLLIETDHILVKRGPKENRNRPSVDALFRSAAYSHGARVIGIVLSGALDDGTSGLWSIKRLGGVTIVQDPAESSFDSMPANALSQVKIDHCLSVHKMGALLSRLAEETIRMDPRDAEHERQKMQVEISVAVDGDAFRKGVMEIGQLTPFTCPECQGVLVKLTEGKLTRFRCHTGHAYSASALLSGVMGKIDESYWAVMRSLEEAAMLLDQIGNNLVNEGQGKAAKLFLDRGKAAMEQSRNLRETVLSTERFSGDSLRFKAGEK